MKKTVLILVALICTIGASAQKYWDGSRADKLFTFGVRAGLNFGKQNALDDQADRDFRLGYQVGVAVDANLARSFSVNTGVLMIQKGWKQGYSDAGGKIDVKDNATYFEIPVLASYRVELSDQAQFQLNLGPYFAFGAFGKQKVESNYNMGNSEIDSFDEYRGNKKFDCGVSIGAGFTFSQIYVGLNYERGLINVSRNTNNKFQNGAIALSLGYNF
ncbi:MAG: PorT family protein [Bacteroidaceae bacterium]|nr:PorT family protein [Bacteroidaceae bacterium]